MKLVMDTCVQNHSFKFRKYIYFLFLLSLISAIRINEVNK